MSKPDVHAESSVRKQKAGRMEHYLPIHQLMDSSKAAMGDNRHRALTHNAWFIGPGGPLERAFGVFELTVPPHGAEVKATNIGTEQVQMHECPHCDGPILVERHPYILVDGKRVSVRTIGEQHIAEDFNTIPGGYIPTAQDYLQVMEARPWMSAAPLSFSPSAEKIAAKHLARRIERQPIPTPVDATENYQKD